MLRLIVMGVAQTITQDNGDGSHSYTVITDDGHVSTGHWYDSDSDCHIDDVKASVTQDALDKD